MPVTKNSGKYLGVPLIHERVSRRTYADFLEKVQGRLSGWKAKLLNMAVQGYSKHLGRKDERCGYG